MPKPQIPPCMVPLSMWLKIEHYDRLEALARAEGQTLEVYVAELLSSLAEASEEPATLLMDKVHADFRARRRGAGANG